MQLVTTYEIIFVLEDHWLCLWYLLCSKIDCTECYLGVFTWYNNFLVVMMVLVRVYFFFLESKLGLHLLEILN